MRNDKSVLFQAGNRFRSYVPSYFLTSKNEKTLKMLAVQLIPTRSIDA